MDEKFAAEQGWATSDEQQFQLTRLDYNRMPDRQDYSARILVNVAQRT